jgi:phosphoglycerate dehydrogenase-like enzyme
MKLLITVPWDENQMLRVKQAFPHVEFITALAEEDIVRWIGDAEVVFGDLSRKAFLNARNVQWIQCHSAGVNNLAAIPELVASSVVVTNTSGAHAATMAEHFMGSLISLTRKLPQLYQAQQRKDWIDWGKWNERMGGDPISLQGMKLGIFGFGNIGRAVGERAAPFQMRVTAVDLCELHKPAYLAELWPPYRLPDLLKESDVVVVAVPSTPVTNGLIDREMLALMKQGSYLAVLSRGGIVDETAVAEMLRDGRLAGAIFDVFKTEPLPQSSPLWDAPNLIITPHSSGKSEHTTAAATAILIENLERYLAGQPLRNVINKSLGF